MSPPTIIFGAFDRHNFGDMLFAHIAAERLARHRPDSALVFAGVATRDLRAHGGHTVTAISELARTWRDERVHIVHAGGELLTCDAWQAAVMLTRSDDAQACIARHGGSERDRRIGARSVIGSDAHAPYVVGRETFPNAASIRFDAIGGVRFDRCNAAMRAEILSKRRTADAVTVRDMKTQTALQAEGIDAPLARDPVAMIQALFGARIEKHANADPVAAVRRAYPNGYLAVQFSADFGDDATLDNIARALDSLAASTKFGIALFRAGAAPWHDDLSVYARLQSRMRHRDATVFASPNIWDICALIAKSAGFAGSSLHGRIVAMAHGLPRVNVLHPDDAAVTGKQNAYAATWDPAGMPGAVSIDELAAAMQEALTLNRER